MIQVTKKHEIIVVTTRRVVLLQLRGIIVHH